MIDDQQGATTEAAFSLPNELIAIVFDELDVVSLLRCKQVCTVYAHSILLYYSNLSLTPIFRYANCFIQ
jgi:hypothetical protein